MFSMRNTAIPVFLILFLSFSCGDESSKSAPLTRDEMVNLMMKVYLAEARTSLLALPKDTAYQIFLVRQDRIMRQMGLSDSTLRIAYSYYLERPAELEAIYDAIIDSLSLREQRSR